MKTINIGNVPVGDEHPTVFMAEIGTFFNNDIKIAFEYTKKAVDAGAHILKTEILHDPQVCLKNTGLLHEYNHAKGKYVENYRALIERKIVALDDYRSLFDFCHKLNVPFVASVYDIEGVDFFVEAGGAAIKIARNNINNIPLIRHAARCKLPVIFDTGGVYLDEIAFALRTARNEGATDLIINHHPGKNPAPAETNNLKTISYLKKMFKIPVGLACHYAGDELLYAAVAMGANILEKGVDVDPKRIEQDVISAARIDDLKEIVSKVQNCWAAMGNENPVPKEPRDLTTRSCLVAKCFIKKGEILGIHNLRFAWPPVGISVDSWDLVEGKKVKNNINEGEIISWNDILLNQGG